MSISILSLAVGALLILMVLTDALLARLLLTGAMIYLCVGFAMGPAGLEWIALDPMRHSSLLKGIAESAMLISLFTVGLKVGGVPLLDRRWMLPLRLALISMGVTIGLVTAVGVWGLGMSTGAALLLGAILAPTDPVLASGVQTVGGTDPDRIRFSLTAEGGLNDGVAFPFVMLALGLLGMHDLGEGMWHWWSVDLLWTSVAGLFIGVALGKAIGRLVVWLRIRHQQAVGRDEFLSLGLIALVYGAAELCDASGFLAVFAAGLALQRVKQIPQRIQAPPDTMLIPQAALTMATGAQISQVAPVAHVAEVAITSAAMTDAVQEFNEQLEKLAEMAIVLLVGAMLPYATPTMSVWWFIPLLFLVIRPIAVAIGTVGEKTAHHERATIAWFGIRGIGSVFYLLYAIDRGVVGAEAQQLITMTLLTVAASIVAHGVSMRPLMTWYKQRKTLAV